MQVHVDVALPDDVFSVLRTTPERFVSEMRLAAAVKWYEVEMVSQAKAAELAGVSRETFVLALSRFRVSPFQATPEELTAEVHRA